MYACFHTTPKCQKSRQYIAIIIAGYVAFGGVGMRSHCAENYCYSHGDGDGEDVKLFFRQPWVNVERGS